MRRKTSPGSPSSREGSEERDFVLEDPEPARRIDRLEVIPGVAFLTAQLRKEGDVAAILRTVESQGKKLNLLKVYSTTMDFVLDEPVIQADCKVVFPDFQVTARTRCAVVRLRSDAIRFLHGVMADMLEALYERGISVYAVGDAYDSVACVVDSAKARQAAQALAKRFELALPPLSGAKGGR